MQNRQFVVVNAFANGPFGGNPAAVFFNASGLEDETRQAFARQLNLVESVFVLPADGPSDFRLRYFTPNAEIPVAGHPSIAAWHAWDRNVGRKFPELNTCGQAIILSAIRTFKD